MCWAPLRGGRRGLGGRAGPGTPHGKGASLKAGALLRTGPFAPEAPRTTPVHQPQVCWEESLRFAHPVAPFIRLFCSRFAVCSARFLGQQQKLCRGSYSLVCWG